MIPFTGLSFFYLLGLCLLPAVGLGLMGRSLRGYGMTASMVMLILVFQENGQLLSLVTFAVWQMLLIAVVSHLTNRDRMVRWLSVLLALLPLTLVKLGEVYEPFGMFRLMGISYMTFRAIEMLLDLCDSHLIRLSLRDAAYFLFFFPSVSSGPIDRFQRFSGDIASPPGGEGYLELFDRGIWKLIGGAVSAIVLGGLVQTYWLTPLPETGLLADFSYMYGYTFYLFFNFAGSSSMAIGAGYLLGIRVPENFRQPFLSVDMKDFWARWHISLSAWLRDYVYTRFVMDCLRKKRFRNQRTASYLGYILTMMTMGVWHGLAPQYLAYGAYHSFLMCVNEFLDLHWKGFRRIKKQGWGQVCCVIVTFHLFAFGLLIFSGRLF